MMNKIQHFPSRLWRLLALALPLAACTSEVTDEALPGGASPITFRTAEVTKAVVTGFNDGDAFSVWGGYGGDATNVFDGVTVTNSNGSWTYSPYQYWIAGKSYRFYAVYPTAETLETNGCMASYSADGVLSITGFDATKGHDLMTAQSKEINGSTPELVVFTFNHKLARLEFVGKIDPSTAAMLPQFKVTVTSASLTGMEKKGDYTGGVWTLTDNSTPLVSMDGNTEIGLDAEGKSLFGDVLYFPQTDIPESYYLNVEYNVQADDVSTPISKNISVQLSSLGTVWESGKYYRYVFTIMDEDHILFSKPTVTAWDEASGGIIVVE